MVLMNRPSLCLKLFVNTSYISGDDIRGQIQTSEFRYYWG